MIWRWLLVLLLVVLAAWSANLTVSYWWGSDRLLNPRYYEEFAFRAKIQSAVTCVILVLTIVALVNTIRFMRKRR